MHLHLASPLVQTMQPGEKWCHNQPSLGLSHIFLRAGLFQSILDEAIQPTMLNLVRRFSNQHFGHILQNHCLQREAGLALPALDQGTSA